MDKPAIERSKQTAQFQPVSGFHDRCSVRRRDIAKDVENPEHSQDTSGCQESKLPSLLRYRVWQRKLSCMAHSGYCENQADQMQEIRAQALVQLQKTHQDQEDWQVLSQVALCLQTSRLSLRSRCGRKTLIAHADVQMRQ